MRLSAALIVAPLAPLALSAFACGASDDSSASADSGASSSIDAAADADQARLVDGAPESSTDAADASATRLSIALPMYVDPSSAGWSQAIGAAPTVSLLIANPNSGPGSAADPSYTSAIGEAHAAGQTVIGYVHTSYAARPIADVEADIDAWYAMYPAIDGIFSDETATDAAKVAPYYAPLYAYVKGKSGRRLVVVNPGTPPDESYMTASDAVMSFDDTYANYVNATPPAWVASYPRERFWHVVLSTPAAQLANAVALAKARNAGIVYVTDQGPATAYQQLVTGAYWQAELTAVAAP